MSVGQTRIAERRVQSILACLVLLSSLLVIGRPSPVAAYGDGSLGGSHRGTTPQFLFVADDNSCSTFTDIDGDGSSDFAYDELDIVQNDATGRVLAGSPATPVANSIIVSFQRDEDGVISKLSCAETDNNGLFSIDVLEMRSGSEFGSIIVAPPITTLVKGTQLGSIEVYHESDDFGDISLAPANTAAIFAVIRSQGADVVTAPFNLACYGFDTNPATEWPDVTAGCGLARGVTLLPTSVVGIKTTTATYGDSTVNVVRFYLASNPGLLSTVGPFNMTGLSGDWAAFNGRWNGGSVGTEDIGGALGTKTYVEATFGSAPTPSNTLVVDPSVTSGSLSVTAWIATASLPETVEEYLDDDPDSPPTIRNLANPENKYSLHLDVYSSNKVGSDVATTRRSSQLSFCPSAGAPTCNDYLAITQTYDAESRPWANWIRNFLTTEPGGGGVPGGGGFCTATTGNFLGRVVTSLEDETGAPNCAYIQISPFSDTAWGGGPGYDWEAGQNGQAPDGQFGFEISSSGIFQLNYYPGPSSPVTPFTSVIRVTVVDGEVSAVESCGDFDLSQGLSESTRCTSGWTPVTLGSTSGRYLFLAQPANFFGRVLDPNGEPIEDDPDTSPAYEAAFIDVQRLQGDSGNYDFRQSAGNASTESGGVFKLRLTTGQYQMRVNGPQGSAYPELSTYLKVSLDGEALQFEQCSTFSRTAVSLDEVLTGCDVISPTADAPLSLQFSAADLTGQVVGKRNFWVDIQQFNEDQCATCYESIGGASANQSGVFAVNFPAAGSYRLVLNPPWGEDDDGLSTRTEVPVEVEVGVNGERSYTVGPDGCVRNGEDCTPNDQGIYIFEFATPNFLGEALNGGSPEPFANASFERWNADERRFEWVGLWANAGSNGRLAASLTAGLWKITVRPGWQNEGAATPAEAYALVEGTPPTVTRVSTARERAETGSGSGTDIATIDGRYPITFGAPNFSGYVTVSVAAERNDTTGAPLSNADAVGWSWIEVQPWNEYEQQYRWSPDVSGLNTSSNGRFAGTLPEGDSVTNSGSRYQVTVHTRPSDATAGRSRGVYRVFVDAGVVKCEVTYAPFCTAGNPPAPGRFDLALGSANLTGTVEAGDDLVVNGQVRAERWNGQWFDWVNLWAQTSSTGRFAMNLDADGTYKVTAEAPTWNTRYAGFASVSVYVKVTGGVLCVVDDQNDESCNGSSNSPLNLSIELVGANVRGAVTDGTNPVPNSPVRNSWVNVSKYNSTLGYWEWAGGSSIGQNGTFSVSLVPTEDGDRSAEGTQQRFRLEVFPPWGNSTLTRKEVQLWVGDVGQSPAGGIWYRECSTATLAGCGGSAQNGNAAPAGNGATLAVVLGAGNVTGKVTTDGTAGMPHASINVEKWMTPSWAREPMWQWIEAFGNTNDVGNYGMDISSLGDGHYRLTANPGWNNPTNATKASRVVYQSGGNVCVVADPSSTVCVGPAASNPYSLNIQLGTANVVGTLQNSGTSVGFAWLGLLQERGGPAGAGDARSSGWYEWLGGANSSGAGGFGLQIETTGRYQIEVNPPWNTTLTRFSVYLLATDPNSDGIQPNEIYVCASRSQSNTDCLAANAVWSAAPNSTLSFPAANVAIRVCSKDGSGTDCTPVANSWVTVFSGNDWVAGATTNNLGIARFRLDDGVNYRFEANPNWASPDGIRVETSGSITVAAGVLQAPTVSAPIIATSAGQIDLRLGSPNVSGSVFYRETPSDAATATAMPWAFVGVRKDLGGGNFEWLPGAPADGTGAYKLALGPGNYTLTAYANSSRERAPSSITVAVAGDLSATCTGGVGANNCSFDFDAAPQNVAFTMSNMGTLTRALYAFSGTSLVTSVAKSPVGGNVSISFALSDGTYTLRVQALNTFATDGSTVIRDFDGAGGAACREYTLVVADGAVTNQAALNTWAGGFDGNDATTGLECAAP